ncbi:MAG: bifunctional riboflavin kinase/FAD synthetase [Cytophagales bacterium]|nr:bifunctional riboflavin kinase/FAD synthetase [Cytophagales bacterium]
MHISRGLPRQSFIRPCALTIGNFDGVHLGHQAILRELKKEADVRGLATCVMTFAPHPREYFAPRSAPNSAPNSVPKRIHTLRDKIAAMKDCGIDHVVILPFNKRLASMSPESFVLDILSGSLQTKLLLIGDDFKFGAKRAGDFKLLASLASQSGYELAAMPSVEAHGIRVSSSAVRSALAEGRLTDAVALLGRAYSISGHVIHGAKLGRTLGVPTLNLAFKHPHPAAAGIFVVRVFGLADTPLRGVANFGTRPALDPSDVNGGRVLLETYCLDWPKALGREGGYGKIIRVELLHKLHDELAYDGLESLKAGIASDIALAKEIFLKFEKEYFYDYSKRSR